MSSFFSAVQFLTRIPIPARWVGDDYQESLRKSLVFFPIVGLLISIVTCSCFSMASHAFPLLIASLLAVSLEAMLTGGFHEDAFADAADALGGGWTREQVLEILKDSRHGTYGVLALVLGVGLRVALIANMDMDLVWFAIPLSGCLGRWAIVWMMFLVPPIIDRHTSVRDLGRAPEFSIVFGSAIISLPGIGIMWWFAIKGHPEFSLQMVGITYRLLFAFLVMAVTCAWYITMIRRRVGGTTGDFLGACCYLVQLTTLLTFACNIFD